MGTHRSYWDEVAQSWSTSQHAEWRALHDELSFRLCRRWLEGTRCGRLLKTDAFDEAVGQGLSSRLGAWAQQVVSVDLSPLALAVARSRRRAEEVAAIAADVRALPFESGTFDAVVSISTLDHFERVASVEASLGELFRVLRPGGRLILTLDNLSNPVMALRHILPTSALLRVGLVPYQVGASCRAGRLGRMLQGVGFRLDRLTAIEHHPRAVAVRLSRLSAANRSPAITRRLRELWLTFELLERWPTRFLTGYFTAALAVRPS